MVSSVNGDGREFADGTAADAQGKIAFHSSFISTTTYAYTQHRCDAASLPESYPDSWHCIRILMGQESSSN